MATIATCSRWPMPTQSGEAALGAAVRNLELGCNADLHPTFGKIFSLRVAQRA